MKRWVIGLAAILMVMGATSVAQAGWFDGVKAGGALIYNDAQRARFETTAVGLHVSADIRPPGVFILTPFYEVGVGKPSLQMVGGSLSWAVAMRDRRTHILYFGATYGWTMSDGFTEPFYGLHVGYKFPLNERMGLYGQIKGLEDDAQVFQGLVASVGMTFAFWGDFKEED